MGTTRADSSTNDAGERQADASSEVLEMVGAAVGGAIGYWVGSVEGAAVGAALPAAIQLALRNDRQAQERRLARASRTILVAAETSELSLQELEGRVTERAEGVELFNRVLQASANAATAKEKVDALGRVLGEAVQDTTTLDEALVIAAALNDLEAPHIRLLAMANGAYNSGEWREPGSDQSASLAMFAKSCGGPLVYPAIMAILSRHGLIERFSRAEPYWWEPDCEVGPSLDLESLWRTTPLAGRCLMLLLPTAPEWARDEKLELIVERASADEFRQQSAKLVSSSAYDDHDIFPVEVNWRLVANPLEYVADCLMRNATVSSTLTAFAGSWKQVELPVAALRLTRESETVEEFGSPASLMTEGWRNRMLSGQEIPPIIVLGPELVVADGYSRIRALVELGIDRVSSIVQVLADG